MRTFGLRFTDGFFTFSCRSDRRCLIAYWAMADGCCSSSGIRAGWYEGYGETCVVVRRDEFVAGKWDRSVVELGKSGH